LNLYQNDKYKKKLLVFSDNTVGIKQSPISSIFEKDLTSLESADLGLFLAKNILTMKLNGAYFEICLKV